MKILVEFFGIPRQRAGRASMEISLDEPATLGDALQSIANALPEFGRHCLSGDRLRENYIANLGGQRFVTDPAAEISNGDSLLILSADAGG